MFVRPKPGLQLRRPDTLTLLPAAGDDVTDLDWCHRRLRDGDALEGPEPDHAAATDTDGEAV